MIHRTGKAISLLLAILLLAGVLSVFVPAAAAAEENPFIKSGTCGAVDAADVNYFVFDDGSIAFLLNEGVSSGAIRDYYPDGTGMPTAPWYDLGDEATMASFQSTKIAIESGVTAIGAYDFYLPSMLTGMLRPMLRTGSIDLPDSLTTIGAHAFENQLKLEKITFPKNLTTIGEDAFKGCTSLYGIDYYGDPSVLKDNWTVGTRFSQLVTLHIKPAYEAQLDALNLHFQPYNIKVEANLYSTIEGDGIERNINISMGQENSGIFGGAVPFVIVGTFSGQKKSVTYGSNGFATAVRIGTDTDGYQYYIHENNNSQNLLEPVLYGTAKYVDRLDQTKKSDLKLELTHEYIGKNIVKVKYRLTNPTASTIDNIQLGSTGDIKIGADDYAAVKPLTETVGGSEVQTGFYMTSTKDYDKSGDDYATLGFIGKNVSGSDSDATFFYGPVAANEGQSSTGAFHHRLFPKRIFDHTGSSAQESGELTKTGDKYPDSGLSYFWNVGTLAPNSSKDFAVLFSVYGANNTKDGQEMVEEKTKPYHTVTWDYNFDGDNDASTHPENTYKVLVEHNDTTPETFPYYTGETPQKPHSSTQEFSFDQWVDAGGDPVTAATMPTCSDKDVDPVFYATYTAVNYVFFAGHSLTLQGDIGVYFYVDVRGAGITREDIRDGNHSVSFAFSWKTTPAPYTDLSADNIVLDSTNYSSLYDSSKGMFKIKCNTAVAEMSCKVHASAIVTQVSDSSIVYTDSDDYSVRDYALTIISSPAGTFERQDKLVDLSKAMLDYGAKAQVVFNIATGSPANAGVDYTMTDVSATTIENAVKSANGDATQSDMRANTNTFGCNYAGSTTMFLSKTSLRHYYTVTDQSLFDGAKSGASFAFSDEKAPYMMFELSNIAANHLDDLQTLTIGGQTYRYSVLDYSKNILNNPAADAPSKNLAKATYWYNYYANAYLG